MADDAPPPPARGDAWPAGGAHVPADYSAERGPSVAVPAATGSVAL